MRLVAIVSLLPAVAFAAPKTRAPKPRPPIASDTFEKLAAEVGPAVVFIRAVTQGGPGKPPSLGTGFIIDAKGRILTNHHVIEGADEVRVRLADDRWLAAEVLGADPKSDVALLKVEPPGPLAVARLGDSDTLQVGAWVIAIGNPWNFDHTVTAGIVSALGRSEVRPPSKIALYANFIQTDAAINQGNSGGPLIDLSGAVIGINSAIFRPNREGGAEGINFAIPINVARQLLPVLEKHGRVPRAWLGLEVQPVSPWLQQAFRLPERRGALVASVRPGSPAAQAGLLPGDVVVELDGSPVGRAHELEWHAALLPVGASVLLGVVREGKRRDVPVRMAPSPEGADAASPPARRRRPPSAIGIAVAEITPELAKQRKLASASGVVVVEVDDGSPALEAGVQRDDVVLRLGATLVRSIDDYMAALRQVKAGQMLVLLLARSEERLWAAFPRR